MSALGGHLHLRRVVRTSLDLIARGRLVPFLAVIAPANPVIVIVGVVLALGLDVENIHKVEVDVTGVMDYPLLFRVVDVHEHLEVAQRRKLDGLFQQSFLALAVGDLID